MDFIEVVILFAMAGGFWYLVLTAIRVFERGKGTPAEIDALRSLVKEIRESHWTMSTKLDRLRAEEDFAARLKVPPINGKTD